MQKFVARFVNDELGATAIEYGLIAALIAVGIITAAQLLGAQIATTFAQGHDRDGQDQLILAVGLPPLEAARLVRAASHFPPRFLPDASRYRRTKHGGASRCTNSQS